MALHTITTEQQCYKVSNIMHRLGGESTFDFVLIEWIGHIKADPKLKPFFSSFDTNSLDLLKRQFLETIFTTKYHDESSKKQQEDEDFDEDAFILLRYYSLIDQGFGAEHFDLMINKHLSRAMNDAWVERDVVEEAIQIATSYRRIFEFGTSNDDEVTVSSSSVSSSSSSSTKSKKRETLIKATKLTRSFSGEALLRKLLRSSKQQGFNNKRQKQHRQ